MPKGTRTHEHIAIDEENEGGFCSGNAYIPGVAGTALIGKNDDVSVKCLERRNFFNQRITRRAVKNDHDVTGRAAFLLDAAQTRHEVFLATAAYRDDKADFRRTFDGPVGLC